MSRYRRVHTPGACYFFTVVTYHRHRKLCREDVRAALRGAITDVRRRHPFHIMAWVLLPDHLHCVWSLPDGDADYPLRWNLIKRCVSRAYRGRLHNREPATDSQQQRREAMFWQRRFWEHRIRDERDLSAHLDYLHYNPVKHGLCRAPVEWPYSSLHRWISDGVYPPDWAAASEPDFGEDLAVGEA